MDKIDLTEIKGVSDIMQKRVLSELKSLADRMLNIEKSFSQNVSKEAYTLKEAAQRLGLSPRSLNSMIAANQIRHLRIGPKERSIRIPEDAIDEYLQMCMRGPACATERRALPALADSIAPQPSAKPEFIKLKADRVKPRSS